MTSPNFSASNLVPRTGHAPGELLWGVEPRRQPVAPLVLMAIVLLLVAAPTALAGSGGSSNPIHLMRQIAESTYELTGLLNNANKSLGAIDGNSKKLIELQSNMGSIAQSTQAMSAKTATLNQRLGTVGAAVEGSRARLTSVDRRLDTTAGTMTSLRSDVTGSVRSTKAVVREFQMMDSAITSMDAGLDVAIGEMAKSAPLTASFTNNKTRLAIAGGDGRKYGVPNFTPDNRVMTISLGMLAVMQKGGPLPARKDRHEASNPIVGAALKWKVPDGTNVAANVQPFDGYYGLPGQDFFVKNRIHGF